MSRVVLITGGIGSGKSVVSQYLKLLGHYVYDCDSEAKKLMNTNKELQQKLRTTFGEEIIIDSKLNTTKLKSEVFNNKESLNKINSIVHPYVAEDIRQHIKEFKGDIFFYESAIPKTGKIDGLSDEIWLVTASLNKRIERVIKRNNISKEEVIKRINAQTQEYFDLKNVNEIINDEPFALMPQIRFLLNS